MKLSKWLQCWFVLTYATPSLSGKQWVKGCCGGNTWSQYNHVHLHHPSSHDELPYSFQTLPVDRAVIGQSFIYTSSDNSASINFHQFFFILHTVCLPGIFFGTLQSIPPAIMQLHCTCRSTLWFNQGGKHDREKEKKSPHFQSRFMNPITYLNAPKCIT